MVDLRTAALTVPLLRRVDDIVAALLDEAEAPAQLANHLPIHRGVTYARVLLAGGGGAPQRDRAA